MKAAPLHRTSRLEPGNGPARRTPLRRAAEEGPPWGSTGKNAATRKSGGNSGRSESAERNSGPTPEVRRLVLERDNYCCVCCGRSVIGQRYSLGHRKRASQGGKAVPSNMLTFLGLGGEACHGRIDSRKDPHDEAKGYTVRSWQDPAQVGVMVFVTPDGSGVTKYPWDDGLYHDEPPEVRAA